MKKKLHKFSILTATKGFFEGKEIKFNLKNEFFVVILALLMIANLLAAIFIVYNKHNERKLFSNIQNLHKEAEELKIKRGQLLLEKATLASFPRIEVIAEDKLHLHFPTKAEIIEIKTVDLKI